MQDDISGTHTNLAAYLTGVNAIIVLDGIATAVLRLVVQSFSCMVHAILAARSEKKVHNFQNNSHSKVANIPLKVLTHS